MKRALLVLAMAAIYLWIRRIQEELSAPVVLDEKAEATWASEGGANPSAAV